MRQRLFVVGTLVLMAGYLLVARSQHWFPFTTPPNVIRWVTQSEDENFGYDVYRGPSAEGPFLRVNRVSILGAGTTDLPQRYEFIDASIEPERVYWYYVESISLDGERERLTPIYPSRRKSAALW